MCEPRLSTVKAGLLYLGCTADLLLGVQKLVGGELETLPGHVATVIMHRNHGNTSIQLLLEVRLFISLYFLSWRHALFATYYLLSLHPYSSIM